ncbi:hypothetical protein HG536_0C03040 [Torulaspora globosa]|uniref:Uncharacterized protein n=1 Tax=Torulaspora globosa TaxID=48254 RepID=A0A7G3ZF50_9SACH|nr:uncharacterized protein HG536_0C03040 [Torulaspora globosa]QLL32136.1 hypothetical protein HG536_0C03040 [Torulaspora globosa]
MRDASRFKRNNHKQSIHNDRFYRARTFIMTTTGRATRFYDRMRQVLSRSERQTQHHRFRRWKNQQQAKSSSPAEMNQTAASIGSPTQQDDKLGCMMVEMHIQSRVSATKHLAAQGEAGHKKLGRKKRSSTRRATGERETQSIRSQNEQIVSDLLRTIDEYLIMHNGQYY